MLRPDSESIGSDDFVGSHSSLEHYSRHMDWASEQRLNVSAMSWTPHANGRTSVEPSPTIQFQVKFSSAVLS